jgi:hypothetical protein
MSLELNIITSREFFRLGTHGEVDWPASLRVLATVAKGFIERGTDRAIVDLRDSHVNLTEEQVGELVTVLKNAGFRGYHRVAFLRHPNPNRGKFTDAAQKRGLDFGSFVSYEEATEWLSAAEEEDPEFDRETYRPPGGEGGPPPDQAP